MYGNFQLYSQVIHAVCVCKQTHVCLLQYCLWGEDDAYCLIVFGVRRRDKQNGWKHFYSHTLEYDCVKSETVDLEG